MVGSDARKELTPEKALRILYGGKMADLRPAEYLKAMRLLRDTDRNLARHVERTLDGVLKRVFPRRRREWHDTSEGMRARLELLPDDPNLEADTFAVREALDLPVNQINIAAQSPTSGEGNDIFGPETLIWIEERRLAGAWIGVHRDSSRGEPNPDVFDELPEDLRASAMARARAQMDDLSVDWLHSPPKGPAPFDGSGSPIDSAVGRLVERHRLPWNAAQPLTFFVLTADRRLITALDPLDVDVVIGDQSSFSSDVEAFRYLSEA